MSVNSLSQSSNFYGARGNEASAAIGLSFILQKSVNIFGKPLEKKSLSLLWLFRNECRISFSARYACLLMSK